MDAVTRGLGDGGRSQRWHDGAEVAKTVSRRDAESDRAKIVTFFCALRVSARVLFCTRVQAARSPWKKPLARAVR